MKGDEFGYFAFGGSTTLIVFQQGRIQLDEDLVCFVESLNLKIPLFGEDYFDDLYDFMFFLAP